MLTKFLSIYCLLYLSSDIIKVTVAKNVKIQIISGSNPLKEKEQLSLQCLLPNNSKSVWCKWQIQTQRYSNKEQKNETFSIHSVDRRDSGNYTCACYNRTTNQLIAISDKMVLQVYSWIKVSLTPQSLSVKKKEVFHLKCETFVENAAANSVTYHWYKNNVHIDVYQPLAEFSVEEDTRFKCGVQRGTTLYGVSEVASVEIKADIETGVLVGIILGAIIAALLLIIIMIWCGYCFVKKRRELQDDKMRQKRLEELQDYSLENGHVLEKASQKGKSEPRLAPLSDVTEEGSLFYEELMHPQLVPKRHRSLILTKSNTSSVINDPLYPVDDEPVTKQSVEKLNSKKFSDSTNETTANDSGPMEQVSTVDNTDKENMAYPNTSTYVKRTPERPTESSENVPELLCRLRKSPIIDLHRSQEDIEQTLNNTEPSYENLLKIKSFIYNGDSEENSDSESRRSYSAAVPHKKKSETYPSNNRYACYDSSSESEDENVYEKENSDAYDESVAGEYENRHAKLNSTLSYASSYSVHSERESDSEIENYNSPRNNQYQGYDESGSDSEMEASGNQNSFYNISNNSFADSEVYSDDDNESGYFNEKDSNTSENIYEENDFSGSDYESGSSAKTQSDDVGVLQKEHVSLEIPIIITPDSSC